MRILDLFKDFLDLSYLPYIYPPQLVHLRDIPGPNFNILRQFNIFWIFKNMTNGCDVCIPGQYINLFKNFYNHSANQVLYLVPEENNFLEQAIFDWIKFFLSIEEENLNLTIELLPKIVSERNTLFRDWINSNFEIELPPLKYVEGGIDYTYV